MVVAALLGCFALLILMVVLVAAPHGALAEPARPQAQHSQQVGGRVALTPTVPTEPTQIDLSQPTAAASTVLAPATSSSLGSNGLTIAVILSCVAGILGLLTGSFALLALVRGGYGPFLRTLLPGKRSNGRYPADRAQRNGHDPSRSPRRPAPTRRR